MVRILCNGEMESGELATKMESYRIHPCCVLFSNVLLLVWLSCFYGRKISRGSRKRCWLTHHFERFQVVAEMEMRKESELGGFNEEGHVLTYEEKQMKDEDLELEEDSASAEGIKDEDFQETRDKVKDLRRLLNDIQSMQQKERRRLTVHAETNEHSHSSMVLNSLTETLLFMAVTGYQVYTIRKWFSGAPVLGR